MDKPEDNSRLSPRPGSSMFGSAFAVVKNYFTPERNAKKSNNPPSPIPVLQIEGPSELNLSNLGKHFAALNLNESQEDSDDSYRTSVSRADESFQSTISSLSAQVPVIKSNEQNEEEDATVLLDTTVVGIRNSTPVEYLNQSTSQNNSIPVIEISDGDFLSVSQQKPDLSIENVKPEKSIESVKGELFFNEMGLVPTEIYPSKPSTSKQQYDPPMLSSEDILANIAIGEGTTPETTNILLSGEEQQILEMIVSQIPYEELSALVPGSMSELENEKTFCESKGQGGGESPLSELVLGAFNIVNTLSGSFEEGKPNLVNDCKPTDSIDEVKPISTVNDSSASECEPSSPKVPVQKHHEHDHPDTIPNVVWEEVDDEICLAMPVGVSVISLEDPSASFVNVSPAFECGLIENRESKEHSFAETTDLNGTYELMNMSTVAVADPDETFDCSTDVISNNVSIIKDVADCSADVISDNDVPSSSVSVVKDVADYLAGVSSDSDVPSSSVSVIKNVSDCSADLPSSIASIIKDVSDCSISVENTASSKLNDTKNSPPGNCDVSNKAEVSSKPAAQTDFDESSEIFDCSAHVIVTTNHNSTESNATEDIQPGNFEFASNLTSSKEEDGYESASQIDLASKKVIPVNVAVDLDANVVNTVIDNALESTSCVVPESFPVKYNKVSNDLNEFSEIPVGSDGTCVQFHSNTINSPENVNKVQLVPGVVEETLEVDSHYPLESEPSYTFTSRVVSEVINSETLEMVSDLLVPALPEVIGDVSQNRDEDGVLPTIRNYNNDDFDLDDLTAALAQNLVLDSTNEQETEDLDQETTISNNNESPLTDGVLLENERIHLQNCNVPLGALSIHFNPNISEAAERLNVGANAESIFVVATDVSVENNVKVRDISGNVNIVEKRFVGRSIDLPEDKPEEKDLDTTKDEPKNEQKGNNLCMKSCGESEHNATLPVTETGLISALNHSNELQKQNLDENILQKHISLDSQEVLLPSEEGKLQLGLVENILELAEETKVIDGSVKVFDLQLAIEEQRINVKGKGEDLTSQNTVRDLESELEPQNYVSELNTSSLPQEIKTLSPTSFKEEAVILEEQIIPCVEVCFEKNHLENSVSVMGHESFDNASYTLCETLPSTATLYTNEPVQQDTNVLSEELPSCVPEEMTSKLIDSVISEAENAIETVDEHCFTGQPSEPHAKIVPKEMSNLQTSSQEILCIEATPVEKLLRESENTITAVSKLETLDAKALSDDFFTVELVKHDTKTQEIMQSSVQEVKSIDAIEMASKLIDSIIIEAENFVESFASVNKNEVDVSLNASEVSDEPDLNSTVILNETLPLSNQLLDINEMKDELLNVGLTKSDEIMLEVGGPLITSADESCRGATIDDDNCNSGTQITHKILDGTYDLETSNEMVKCSQNSTPVSAIDETRNICIKEERFSFSEGSSLENSNEGINVKVENETFSIDSPSGPAVLSTILEADENISKSTLDETVNKNLCKQELVSPEKLISLNSTPNFSTNIEPNSSTPIDTNFQTTDNSEVKNITPIDRISSDFESSPNLLDKTIEESSLPTVGQFLNSMTPIIVENYLETEDLCSVQGCDEPVLLEHVEVALAGSLIEITDTIEPNGNTCMVNFQEQNLLNLTVDDAQNTPLEDNSNIKSEFRGNDTIVLEDDLLDPEDNSIIVGGNLTVVAGDLAFKTMDEAVNLESTPLNVTSVIISKILGNNTVIQDTLSSPDHLTDSSTDDLPNARLKDINFNSQQLTNPSEFEGNDTTVLEDDYLDPDDHCIMDESNKTADFAFKTTEQLLSKTVSLESPELNATCTISPQLYGNDSVVIDTLRSCDDTPMLDATAILDTHPAWNTTLLLDKSNSAGEMLSAGGNQNNDTIVIQKKSVRFQENVSRECTKITDNTPTKLNRENKEYTTTTPVSNSKNINKQTVVGMNNKNEAMLMAGARTCLGVLKEINDNIVDNTEAMGHFWSLTPEKPLYKPPGLASSPSKKFGVSLVQNLSEFNSDFKPDDFEVFDTSMQSPGGMPRDSLYVKFDPLFQIRSKGDSTMFIDALKEATEKSKPLPNVNVVAPIPAKSASAKQLDIQMEITRLKELYLDRVRKEEEREDALKKKRAEFDRQQLELEGILLSSQERQVAMSAKLKSLSNSNKTMFALIPEYQRTLEVMTNKISKERENNKQQIEMLSEERDSYRKHLASAESAFVDVMAKYERVKISALERKEVQSALEREEAELRRSTIRLDDRLKHAERDGAEEVDALERILDEESSKYSKESTRLRAQLRKSELNLNNMQETLDKKVLENQKLAGICDDLIAGRS